MSRKGLCDSLGIDIVTQDGLGIVGCSSSFILTEVDDQGNGLNRVNKGTPSHILFVCHLFVLHLALGTLSFGEAIQTIRIATGPADGTYRILGTAIKTVVEKANPTVRVELLTTAGSIENFDLLTSGEVEFALAQRDVALQQKDPDSATWRYALVLAQEPVHLVLRNAIGEPTFSSLAGREVFAGAKSSGTRFTASAVLGSLGITDSKFVEYASGEEAVKALFKGEIDAGFFVGAPPVPLVAYLLADPAFSLAGVTPEEMVRIRDNSSAYTLLSISSMSYPRLSGNSTTLSVSTVFLCTSELDDELVAAVCKSLLDDIGTSNSTLRSANPGIHLTSVLRDTEKAGDDQRQGESLGLRSVSRLTRMRALYQWFEWLTFVAIVLGLMSVSIQRPLRIRVFYVIINHLPYSLRRPVRVALFNHTLWRVLTAFTFFMLIWLLGTVAIYYAEHEVNLNFFDLRTSSLSMLLYLFSNVEGRIPATSQGWLVFIAMLVLGLLVGAYITGEFATAIIRRTVGGLFMNRDIAKHSLLVIGWSDRAEQIVHEFFSAFEDGISEFNITVLTEIAVNPSTVQEYVSRGVTFLSGNCTDKRTLLLIGAAKARSIVILADDNARDPDARTTMTILALNSLFKELKIPVDDRPHTSAEVQRVGNVELARDAGACAVVCHQHIGTGLLAQAAITDKILPVYQSLLSYSRDGCEIYILSSKPDHGSPDIPQDLWTTVFEGKSVWQAQYAVHETLDPANSMLILGYMRGTMLNLAPPSESKLCFGDDLVVLAWSRPRLNKVKTKSLGLIPTDLQDGDERMHAAGAPTG